ncbi:MAG: thiamine phosphate synthase [Nitrospirae bacterium]|nr:thiamine phosphate synthase [Nitrospirota bacterium]
MARLRLRSRPPLYLITDRQLAGLSHIEIACRALASGISIIQLREKQMSKKDLYRQALAVRILARKHGAAFIINDYIDIALAADADGVHLGQEDLPVAEARRIMGRKKIIGVSTHSLKQAVAAQREGADYIGFGPMFETSTKDAGTPKGLKLLREVRRRVAIPIVAIGGISRENASDVLRSGADAVAVMSAILRGDIRENVKKFLAALNGAQGKKG